MASQSTFPGAFSFLVTSQLVASSSVGQTEHYRMQAQNATPGIGDKPFASLGRDLQGSATRVWEVMGHP